MPTSGGLTRPLCFALITHWIGGALGTFALLILWSLFSKSFRLYSPNLMPSSANFFSHSPFFERGSIHHWFFGLVPVILDPFITLFSILFTSLFVYIGARILIPFKRNAQTKNTQTKYTQDGKAVTYESIVRIFCFGMSPSILTAIPLLGGGVSSIWVFVLNLIGMREIYKISTARSLVVLFFPSIVFFGMIALGFLIILVLAMQFLATFFV